jgi:hypothetical protein
MITAVSNMKSYFQAPAGYFWRWTEKNEVIEWKNGSTICYRDELVSILQKLPAEAIPRIGTVLMLLTACQGEFNLQQFAFLRRAADQFKDATLYDLLSKAIELFNLLTKIPNELKSGERRADLINEIMAIPETWWSFHESREAMDELKSGRLDAMIAKEREEITKEEISADLQILADAVKRFPNSQSLELKLRTGLAELPEAVDIPVPKPSSSNLFEELLNDPVTEGIARLYRRIISVLNIPMHSQNSGEQSYGGISDITNRGNYDRLLLSELAQDDLLLMARLVNNEALYFRREEPPDNPKRKRTILLDTTLKMWGLPRVFGISVALAFAHHSKHGEIIESYALGGEEYSEINLSTREGIIAALEKLHHGLDCGKALNTIVNEIPASDQNEYVLVISAQAFNSKEFHAALSAVKDELRFITTVDRSGELQFFECTKGRVRLLNTALLDLRELLNTKTISSPVYKRNSADLPAFFNYTPAPLLFPKNKLKGKPERFFAIEDAGTITINQSQRVLLFPHKEKGAYELLDYIERGTYTFGWDGDDIIYILVNNRQRHFQKLYNINKSTFETTGFDLSGELNTVTAGFFRGSELFVRTETGSSLVDCKTGKLVTHIDDNSYAADFNAAKNIKNAQGSHLVQEHVTQVGISYNNTMFKIKNLYIFKGRLSMGIYELRAALDGTIRISDHGSTEAGEHYSKEVNSGLRLLKNKEVKFSKRVWQDGSEAIVDGRGFLHLKSSDKSLAEITIVLATGNRTSCWSSDGMVCGDDYYIDTGRAKKIPVEDFYRNYIQKFIDRLVKP